MKKFAALFATILISVASLSVSFVQAAGTSTIVLSQKAVSVKTGESFSLILYVNPGGASLDSARAEISFDASMLEITSFDLQKQFPNPSPGNSINNQSGQISYGAYRYGSPITYSGQYAVLNFRALKSGGSVIAVKPTSKLIQDGAEMMNTTSLDSTTVSIDGAPVPAIMPIVPTPIITPPPYLTPNPLPLAPPPPPPPPSNQKELEKQALVYFGAFYGRMPKAANDWAALKCFANGGCKGSPRNIDAERKSLVTFGAKYKKMPKTTMEWNVVDTLAYTSYLKPL